MAMKLHDHFKEFLRLFNEHRVEYLLIGGYAALISMRVTPMPFGRAWMG